MKAKTYYKISGCINRDEEVAECSKDLNADGKRLHALMHLAGQSCTFSWYSWGCRSRVSGRDEQGRASPLQNKRRSETLSSYQQQGEYIMNLPRTSSPFPAFRLISWLGWLLSCRSCRLCREFLGSQCSRRQSAPILTRTGLDWNTNIIQAAIIFRWLSNLRAGFEYRIDWRDPNLWVVFPGHKELVLHVTRPLL